MKISIIQAKNRIADALAYPNAKQSQLIQVALDSVKNTYGSVAANALIDEYGLEARGFQKYA